MTIEFKNNGDGFDLDAVIPFNATDRVIRVPGVNAAINLVVTITGTINITLQTSLLAPENAGSGDWVDLQANKSTNFSTIVSTSTPVRSLRFVVNSGTGSFRVVGLMKGKAEAVSSGGSGIATFISPQTKPLLASDFGVGVAMEVDTLGVKRLYGSDAATWGLLRRIGVGVINSFEFANDATVGDNLFVKWDVSNAVSVDLLRDRRTGLGYEVVTSSTESIGIADLGVVTSGYLFNLFKVRTYDSNGFYNDSDQQLIYDTDGDVSQFGPALEVPLFSSTKYYSNGTVSTVGTAVTGLKTGWVTEEIAAGSKIGFGSKNIDDITTWFTVSTVTSNTSITLTAAPSPAVTNSLYVVVDSSQTVIPVFTTVATPPGVLDYKNPTTSTNLARFGFADALNIARNMTALQRNHGGWGELAIDGSNSIVNLTVSDLALASARQGELNREINFDKPDNPVFTHACAGVKETSQRAVLFMLKCAQLTQKQQFIIAANKGLDYILNSQHSSGGWQHTYPSNALYGGNLIVNNDGASRDLMTLLRSIVENPSVYTILPTEKIVRCQTALNKLIQFLLNTQVVVGGIKRGWPLYANKDTLLPAGGRAHESPSIDGASTRFTLFCLMDLPNPSAAVVDAVDAGIAWLNQIRDNNVQVINDPTPQYANGYWYTFKENPYRTSFIRRKTTANHAWRFKIVPGSTPDGVFLRSYSLVDAVTPMFGDYEMRDPTLTNYDVDPGSHTYVNDGLPVLPDNSSTWTYLHGYYGYQGFDQISIIQNRSYGWVYPQITTLNKYAIWKPLHP